MSRKIKDVAGVLKYMRGRTSFDRVLEKVKILSIGDGTCFAELKLEDEHVNSMGVLHSGLATTLVDCISGYALMTKIPNAHVSIDIHFSFTKKILKGDTILIDGWVNKFGKTMAFLEVEMRDKASGETVIKGTHSKYIL
ncbi:hypothetical protein Zmor_027392 [Zophobas morio]|uniref:Thioesterase domain-containing protein n=1 Tax=Zophobas morio TaxID=2755281 RepID=A0AA38HPT8_9CUCU|nr:hypothetical protein Zmor_027392 [Zophobas morio]